MLRNLARKLRRGGPNERPVAATARVTEAETERVIRRIIPEEAGIAVITFDAGQGEVTIVATRPAMAIGPLAGHLRMIRWETGWKAIIARAPPSEYRE